MRWFNGTIFSFLPLSLTRQISQINEAKPLILLVKSLKITTVIHDYFHETQFHRQDVIYRVYYPCFLQCFQLHLARKRLNGNPVKKDMQSHHMYLLFIYDCHLIHLFNCFVRDINPCIGKGPGPDLAKLDKSFQDYFQSMIVSVDEPLKVCATFVKTVRAYLRC